MTMNRYALASDSRKSVRVMGKALNLSYKSSGFICKTITGMPLTRARELLDGIESGKKSLDGRYYSKTVAEFTRLLAQAEHNAEFKGMDPARLVIFASASKAFGFWRPRRFKLRRREKKLANIQIVLKAR